MDTLHIQRPCASMKQQHVSPFSASLKFIHTATSVTVSSLPNLFPWMASLRAQKRWKSEGARSGLYGGWRRTVQQTFDCFPCFKICVWSCCLVLWEDFSSSFVRSNSPEMLLQVLKSLNVQIWDNGLHVVWCLPESCLLHPKKTVAVTFPAEGVALNFFHWEAGWCHSRFMTLNCTS